MNLGELEAIFTQARGTMLSLVEHETIRCKQGSPLNKRYAAIGMTTITHLHKRLLCLIFTH